MYKINKGIQFLESKFLNLQMNFNDTKKKSINQSLFFLNLNKK